MNREREKNAMTKKFLEAVTTGDTQALRALEKYYSSPVCTMDVQAKTTALENIRSYLRLAARRKRAH